MENRTWKKYEKYMENTWKIIHKKYVENKTWKIYEKYMENNN